jgi:hypothetical protein
MFQAVLNGEDVLCGFSFGSEAGLQTKLRSGPPSPNLNLASLHHKNLKFVLFLLVSQSGKPKHPEDWLVLLRFF